MTPSSDPRAEIRDLLPSVIPLQSLRVGAGEVLILAPGFEDRTIAIPQGLSKSSSGSAILLDYRPQLETNQLDRARHILLDKGVSVQTDDIVEYDRFDPNDFPERLRGRLGLLEAAHVIVDISTMSKLAVMLVMKVCLDLGVRVTVVYSEAATYGPSQQEFGAARARNAVQRPSLQVFTGVFGVVRIECLASVAMQGQPTAALAFMSFNDALTQVLLNTVYPARLFLINSRPPKHSWREGATAWIHEPVRREWESDNPVNDASGEEDALPRRTASTLDYRDTVESLLELYWILSATHRVLLAPAGSKMQAVGCFLVKALHPDIHIEYPSPEGFAKEYSEGVGERWMIQFGNIKEWVGRLSRRERDLFLKVQLPENSV